VKRLAIYGASGHGKVVADIAELNGWQEIVFFDQAASQIERNGDWSVAGDFDDLLSQKSGFDAVIVAIGNNRVRSEKSALLRQFGLELTCLTHPSAIVSRHATVAKGTVIMANAVVNPFSTVGENVIVNTGAIVEHDSVIGDGVHLCPGVNLAGGVTVGQRTWVGIGATVIQQCLLGEESIIGAGSVVIDDIPSHVTACGVPAKIIKSH
jgi:sugar O-acyltransferase (sialic acid O-acetyltransferase NeuD family)